MVENNPSLIEGINMLHIRQLPPTLAKKVKNELKEDPIQLENYVAHIREWLDHQPHLIAYPSDQYIVSALRACRYSLERFKRKYEAHLTAGAQVSEYVYNRDIENPQFQEILKLGCVLPLPNHISEDGSLIVIFRPGYCDLNTYDFVQLVKVHSVLFDIFSHENDNFAISGYIAIFDMTNCGLNLAMQFNPALVFNSITYFQKTVPFQVIQSHIINLPATFTSLFNMAKGFLSYKTLNKLHLHGHDFESLYKYVPQNVLPKEYGGVGPSIDEFAEINLKLIKNNAKLIKELDSHYVDERKRDGFSENRREMIGSFRQLNVD